MHAAVRMYRVTDIDALVRKVEDEFVERVKEIDGFVGYYVIDGGDGTAASVTVGETEDAVLQVTNQFTLPLAELREAWSRTLREAFAAGE
jgi:hypothetical protein